MPFDLELVRPKLAGIAAMLLVAFTVAQASAEEPRFGLARRIPWTGSSRDPGIVGPPVRR
jgi:hypothetical protein